MNEAAVLAWFHDSWYGQLMVQVRWLFSVYETLHFIGLSLMVGALLVIDLAVMGALPMIPLSRAMLLVRYAVLGFAINLITGVGFFCFNPEGYWSNPAFRLKMLAVLLAGANAVWFALRAQPRLRLRGDAAPADTATRVSAGLSLGLWLAVIVAGRLLPTFQSTGTG